MRVDYEEMQLYSKITHIPFDELAKNYHINNINYYTQTGKEDEWFYKTSPYHIFDVLKTRDTGIYEIWYDYIKRHVERRSAVFDYGAGIGTLEVLLLKRYPAAISVYEQNLVCFDFVHWRMARRGYELSPLLDHYNYIVSLDTLQRLPTESIASTLGWLFNLGDHLFIYANSDNRHPLFNELPFDIEKYAIDKGCKVENFHGLLDIEVTPHEE